jgi:hypothetical protein
MKAKPSLSTLSLFTKSAVAVIFALIFGAAAFAQIDRAELEGTVTDPSGAAVAGASVKIVTADTASPPPSRQILSATTASQASPSAATR